MQKFITPLCVFLLFSSKICFSQENSNPIFINKQVEIVEYNYQYVFIEFISSLHFSLNYPVITSGERNENQQFFERGRNVRTGFDIGFTQRVKTGNWSLITGISFQQYNEFFSYNEYETRQLAIQNQDGSIQTILIAIGEPVSQSRINQLGYLKIPIGLEYYPERLNNKAGIGLQFNYHYLLSTNYMTKYSTYLPAGYIASEDFNSSFLSLSGSVIVHLKIFKNLSVTLEPYYSIGLNNLIDQTDLKFGMNEIGIHTGLSLFY